MSPEQLQQFNEMYQWFKNMQKSSSIPLPTHQAITERYLNGLLKSKGITDINASNREQTTSVGGGDLVPQTFTDLIKIEHPVTKITIYIPYYT